MLVDSPVIAGAHFRSYPLGPNDHGPAHTLDIVADSEAALALEPAQIDGIKRLVVEAGALFGARHYARYHFLLTLSDKVAHFGLEHHQSSDNRTRERFLIDTTRACSRRACCRTSSCTRGTASSAAPSGSPPAASTSR